MEKDKKTSVDNKAPKDTKHMIYQKENLEKPASEETPIPDNIVEKAICKINPDENSMDSRG
jgi:hypothetical protein